MFRLFDQAPSRPVEASSDGLKLLLLAIQSEGSDPYNLEPSEQIQLPPISATRASSSGSLAECQTEAWRVHITTPIRDVQPAPQNLPVNGHKRCHQCGATETPKWRRGQSDGHSGVRLCNACGIRSKRLMRRKVPKHSHSSDRLDKKRQKELKRAFLQDRKSRSATAYIHHSYSHERLADNPVLPMVLSSYSS